MNLRESGVFTKIRQVKDNFQESLYKTRFRNLTNIPKQSLVYGGLYITAALTVSGSIWEDTNAYSIHLELLDPVLAPEKINKFSYPEPQITLYKKREDLLEQKTNHSLRSALFLSAYFTSIAGATVLDIRRSGPKNT